MENTNGEAELLEKDMEEYLNEKDAKTLKKMFKENLKSYKEKDSSITDEEWLEQLFGKNFPNESEKDAKKDALKVVESIKTFDANLKSINEAAKCGKSKESWLADKIQEASIGLSVQEAGRRLQAIDDVLHVKNVELESAIQVSRDGEISRINMNPNLDGILAENVVAKTTELSGVAQGKNIRVDVLQSNKANSVDVRAINLDTGKYQNYQLKFGKDATHTIKYIENGNYNNQQIIVPKEQVEEVRAYFKEKGSQKTITDHINAWGAEGRAFTKEELKEIQKCAQEEGKLPQMDYSHFDNKDLAKAISKETSAMTFQAMALTTGLTIAKKAFDGEKIEPDEMVELALKTGIDTSIKTVAAGTLQVAVRKGIVRIIPKATPVGIITDIACVGIENTKIIAQIASGKLSMTKGLDQMGRVTTTMIGGLVGAGMATAAFGITATGTVGMAATIAAISTIGVPLAIVTGLVVGMVGYLGGSKFGDMIYSTGKKVASAAKTVAKVAWDGVKSAGRKVASATKSVVRTVKSWFC